MNLNLRIVPKTPDNIVLESVQPKEDELDNFFRVTGDESGLGYDIYVEECEYHVWENKPHMVYVRLNEENYFSSAYYKYLFIPISVCKDPNVLCSTTNINISSRDLFEIKQYVKLNLKFFESVSRGSYKFKREDFKRCAVPKLLVLNEGRNSSIRNYLCEMPNVHKSDSNLNNNIWIDTGEDYKKGGHANRVKIQNDYSDHITGNWISMSLYGNKEIHQPNKVKISNDDIEKVRKFIDYNYHILTDKNLASNYDVRNLIKVGKNNEPILPYNGNPYEYTVSHDVGGGYKMVRAKNDMVNIINPNGNLISNEWFRNVTYFQNDVIQVLDNDYEWWYMDRFGKKIGKIS